MRAAKLTTTHHILIALGLIAVQALVEHAMGRVAICTCGYVKFWEGEVNSAGKSQHLTDWYSFSHLIHGFGFYLLFWLVGRRWPVGARFLAALSLEISWEVIENSGFIIDRYREVTMAYGYAGDSVLNSVSDAAFMIAGFLAASRMRWWATVALALAFELLTLWAIRDNLTLNILMLASPIEAVKEWQAGG